MARTIVKIEGDASGLEAALKKGEKSLEGFKEMLVGAFTIEAVKELASHTMELGAQLTNTALRLDMTVEQVQVLKQAAKDSGVEFEKLQGVLDKLSIAKAKALGGDKESLKAFGEFGINQQQLKSSRSVDLLFGAIAESVKANGGEALAGPLSELVGKSFGEVTPLLKEDLGEVGDDLKKMGGIMSTDTAVKLKVLGDQFELLGTQIETVLGPAIIDTAMAIENGISKYLHFIDSLAGNDKKKEDQKDNGRGFLANAWDATKGVGAGLVGLGSVALSGGGLSDNRLYQFGLDEMNKANGLFYASGTNGGIIDKITDQMVKGNSIGDDFDNAFVKPLKEKSEKLKQQILSNSDKVVDVTPETKEATHKHFRVYADAMTETGNMLGHSFTNVGGTALDIQRNQLETQRQMKEHLAAMKQSMDSMNKFLAKIVPQPWN